MAAPYPSFPASPTIGQTYTDANGAVWTFSNIGWTKTLVSLTSDPSIWQDIDSALSYDSSGNVTIAGGLTAGGKVSIPLGTAPLPSLYFGTDTNTGIYSPGADQVGIATNGTSRLVVDASGNVNIDSGTFYVDAVNNRVGVGTATPGSSLELSGSGSACEMRLRSTDTTNAIIRAYVNSLEAGKIAFTSGRDLFIETAGSERLRLDASGNFLVGLTTGAKFSVSYGGNDTHFGLGANYDNYITAGSSGVTIFRNGTTERCRIDSSGRLLVGTSSARTAAIGGNNQVVFEAPNNYFNTILASNTNTTDGSFLSFIKSRGTAAGSHTIVASGDDLGVIDFEGADGSVARSAAQIKAQVDGAPGAGDMPGRLVFSTTADGAASPTERMRIGNGGATGLYCDATNDTLYASSAAAAGTTRYLFIGKYSATSPITTGTNSILIFTNGNIQNTNNSYGAISDIKLKENIVDATSQWSDIKSLQIRKYNFKEGQTHTQIGLIAQEVELVSPGLVSESPDRDADGNDLGTVTKSVNYSVLYMKAVKALQEAMERIETLEAKVAALESH